MLFRSQGRPSLLYAINDFTDDVDDEADLKTVWPKLREAVRNEVIS